MKKSMNWYKLSQWSAPKNIRTLYHGTSIENLQSIKQSGLVPRVGTWVSSVYGPRGMSQLVFAADRRQLGKSIEGIKFHVAQQIGSDVNYVTLSQVAELGLLVVVKQPIGTNLGFKQRPISDRNQQDEQWQDHPQSQAHPAVESGDYYNQSKIDKGNLYFITGNKLIDLIRKNHLQHLFVNSKFEDDKARNLMIGSIVGYYANMQKQRIGYIDQQELDQERQYLSQMSGQQLHEQFQKVRRMTPMQSQIGQHINTYKVTR